MIEDQDKKEFETLVPETKTPGEMLKRAREAKKLSHIDVAKQLKLKVQWVMDIENDHYENALALIYVRGHLRSYAKLVDLPPEQVMQAFEKLNIEEPLQENRLPPKMEAQFMRRQAMLPRPRKKSGGKVVAWIAVILAIVIIILVSIWWRGQKLKTDDSTQAQVVFPVATHAIAAATKALISLDEKPKRLSMKKEEQQPR